VLYTLTLYFCLWRIKVLINTWRGREHHTRKLERTRSSIEIARRCLGGCRCSSRRRQPLHWTPVHQLHRRVPDKTEKTTVTGRRRQSPLDGRPSCALWRRSIARWSDHTGCAATFVLVPLLCTNARETPVIVTGGGRMSLPDSALAFLPFPRPVAWRRMPADRLNTPASTSAVGRSGASAASIPTALPPAPKPWRFRRAASDIVPWAESATLSPAYLPRTCSSIRRYRRRPRQVASTGISRLNHCNMYWLTERRITDAVTLRSTNPKTIKQSLWVDINLD